MPARRLHLLALLAVLAASFAARLSLQARTSPYVLQEDELYVTDPARRMLREGTLDPGAFQYPSLPLYLAAGGLALGALLDPAGGPPREPGEMRIYYDRPRVGGAARALFALAGVLALGLAGLAGARAFGEPALLWLAPLAGGLSARFLAQSWTYLNVDVVGACACAGALLWLVASREREGLVARAVVPGLLTGCAVSCKYYLGLVGLPFALALLRDRRRLPARAACIAACTALGFLATTPYALLDWPTFRRDVAFELQHYGGGHRGAEGRNAEPGLEQLALYAGDLAEDLGPAPLALALAGAALALARRETRASALLLGAFPAALLLFLCAQRVHFPRNLTSVLALLPVATGLGALALWRAATRALRPLGRAAAPAAAALVLAAVAAGAPRAALVRAYGAPLDSRLRAEAWVLANAEPGRPVLVAAELQLDVRRLEARHPVVRAPAEELVRAATRRRPLLVLPDAGPGTPLAAARPELARAQAELALLARFGAGGIAQARGLPIQGGDPRLAILEPAKR